MAKRRRGRVQRVLNAVADAVIEAVNPRLAARRAAWRQNGHMLASMSAAAGGRLMDWNPTGGDANSVTLDELPTVRARARDASLNNAIYDAVRETMVQHVVGEGGIIPRSMVDAERLGITPQQAEQWQGACDDLWKTRSRLADVTGRQKSWGDFLALVYRSMFDGGDVFPSFPLQAWPDAGLMTRVNLIEAERVETPYTDLANPRIRGGVQLDAWGTPQGFHVLRAHPGDDLAPPGDRLKFEYWPRQRAGRTNVLQLYRQLRVGQSRGIPRLASVLGLIDQVDQYADTTLIAAEMQTRLSFWIKTMADPEEVAEGMSAWMSLPQREGVYDAKFGGGVDPGSVNVLHAGDDVQTVGSQHPNNYFDPFVVRLLRLVTSVTKVPYSIAFGDSGSENYSSMRRQWQSFKHTIGCEQNLLLPLCEAFWFHTVYDAWLTGELLPGESWVRFEDAPELWSAAIWTKPVLGNVDPTKETKSDIDAIGARIRSPQEVIRSNGGDHRQVLRDFEEWEKELKERGLSSAAPAVDPSGEQGSGDPDDPTGKDEDFDLDEQDQEDAESVLREEAA